MIRFFPQAIILSMQIKKLDWINRPEKIRVTAHSLTFKDDRTSVCLHTTGVDDEVKLTYEGDGISFIMLHTENDYILLEKDRILSVFAGFRAEFPSAVPSTIIVRKKGEEISFLREDGEILYHISNPAFADSASFGFKTGKTGRTATLLLF